ncbi:pilin [Glycomyces sp. MUSA5-2]|uniref:pilin n=1 Tax=Glycomyces sp. MUSA5-2 TaxID=2053002 RepID=UPI00300B82E0
MRTHHSPRPEKPSRLLRLGMASGLSALFFVLMAEPAMANTQGVIDVLNRLQTVIVVIAGTAVAVMLTLAGFRYLLASEPGETERAKSALRSAAIGFGIVVLAPILVTILKQILSGE